MQFLAHLAVFAALLASQCAAIPAAADPDTSLITKRDVSVESFTHGGCNYNNGYVSSYMTTCGRCQPVVNKGSIRWSGSGGSITTWSGNNCRGSSLSIPNGPCVDVLHASYSFDC